MLNFVGQHHSSWIVSYIY